MKREELLKHISETKGAVWFNNGSTRSRCVTGFNGYMICYYTPSNPDTTTCVLLDHFARWAKGVGRAGEKKPPRGIMPEFIWFEKVGDDPTTDQLTHRKQHIAEAIERFREADVELPAEWLLEYVNIQEEIDRRKGVSFNEQSTEILG